MNLSCEMPPTDEEGYLVDPGAWTEAVAEALAGQENIELTAGHREAIRFMRDYFLEHQVIPDVRFVTRHLAASVGGSRNLIFELFPYGYVKQACRIAGMKRPRGWSTG